MSLQIDFNADRWTRSNALLWIFFSDWEELETDVAFFDEMAKCVTALILDKPENWPNIPQEDKQTVLSIIDKLYEITPAIRKTKDANTLLWIRFAFTALRNGIYPSNNFMNAYARWRHERSVEEPCRKIIRLVDGISKSEKSLNIFIKKIEYESYSLDSFLITESIPADINSTSHWLIFPSKRQTPRVKKKRDIKDIIGRVAYHLIQDSIIDAAKYGKIRGLLNNKIDGRYESTISRDDLAIALKAKYIKTLVDRESTIVRAISEFVACPNHRKRR